MPLRSRPDRSSRSFRHPKETHARLLKHEPSAATAATAAASILSLASHGGASYAQLLFSQLARPSVFHWNNLIRGLSSSSNPHEAILVFRSMLRGGFSPNNFTYPFLLKACTACVPEPHGCVAHARIVKTGLELDRYIQSGLIRMYTERRNLGAARRVLEQCIDGDIACWNAMLDGYVKAGELDLARAVFDRMERKDVISWNTMLNGYAILGDASEAQNLFDRMPERNLVSWNSMLTVHGKCGDVEGARRVFADMPQHDVISWNTMLACLAQSRCSEEAQALFEQMRGVGEKPTDATMVSLLSACSHLGALDRGRQLHQYMDEHKIKLNTILSTALVDMYAKCGSISRAKDIFRTIEHKDLLAWNAIMSGMAIHGRAEEALQLFDEMTKSGISPDDVTFVMLLSACSHSGIVTEGRRVLNCMKGDYGITPKIEHFGCVIDLLARRGLLQEAMELTRAMPMEPNAPAWGALLGGCRIHRNSEVAAGVGKHLLSLQPMHSGRYVLLSNIYATAGRWEDAKEVRGMMSTKGISKIPGTSMIEMEGKVNQFVAGDRSHPESESIYRKLMEALERLKVEAGYLADTREVLLDIEEEEKVQALLVHSEKLAIALGLLHTHTSGESIRVMKNLRVCSDCHNFAKLISRVYGREIIMRDRNRFHLFKEGDCSCMDFW